jgi:hypothetical protein
MTVPFGVWWASRRCSLQKSVTSSSSGRSPREKWRRAWDRLISAADPHGVHSLSQAHTAPQRKRHSPVQPKSKSLSVHRPNHNTKKVVIPREGLVDYQPLIPGRCAGNLQLGRYRSAAALLEPPQGLAQRCGCRTAFGKVYETHTHDCFVPM